jgi:hypothetical protein
MEYNYYPYPPNPEYEAEPSQGFRTEWDIELNKRFGLYNQGLYLPGSLSPTAPWRQMNVIQGPEANYWPTQITTQPPTPAPVQRPTPRPYYQQRPGYMTGTGVAQPRYYQS